MREVTAIVEQVVDTAKVGREIHAELIKLQDDERSAGARRIRIGRLLMSVRHMWPRGGRSAKGWGDYVAALGISQDTALDWMQLAGYVDSDSDNSRPGREKTPSRREVKAAKHEASGGTPRDADADDKPDPPKPKSFDLSRELLAVHHKVMDVARSWPVDARNQLAQKLRIMAETIEEMSE